MQSNYLKVLRYWLKQQKSSDQPLSLFAVNLIEVIIMAKTDLGEEISAETLQDDINDLDALRDRYLDTRWSKAIGHNYTLSQLEIITRRYSQSYINKVSAVVWPALKMTEEELRQITN